MLDAIRRSIDLHEDDRPLMLTGYGKYYQKGFEQVLAVRVSEAIEDKLSACTVVQARFTGPWYHVRRPFYFEPRVLLLIPPTKARICSPKVKGQYCTSSSWLDASSQSPRRNCFTRLPQLSSGFALLAIVNHFCVDAWSAGDLPCCGRAIGREVDVGFLALLWHPVWSLQTK